MWNKLNFLDKLYKKLFFSDIKIIFFAFFFIMSNVNILARVSTVFPDFDIIIKRISENFLFFLKFKILSSSKLSKK